MPYIIDGHNLIGVLPDIQLGQPDDESRLLDRLRAFRAHKGGRSLIVFFDSSPLAPDTTPATRPDALSGPGIEVRFARPGQSADDAIVAFLAQNGQPGHYAVVTNDRDLAVRARSLGASVVSADDFAGRIAAKQPKADDTAEARQLHPRAAAFADLYAHFLTADKAAALREAKPADFSTWVERLYTADPQLVQRAALWLGQFGGRAALEPLQDALTHADARVRGGAALALGQLGEAEAVPALCRLLLEDGNSMVRQAAAQALGRLGRRAAVPALEQAAARDAKSKVRKAAVAALAQIRERKG